MKPQHRSIKEKEVRKRKGRSDEPIHESGLIFVEGEAGAEREEEKDGEGGESSDRHGGGARRRAVGGGSEAAAEPGDGPLTLF